MIKEDELVESGRLVVKEGSQSGRHGKSFDQLSQWMLTLVGEFGFQLFDQLVG